MMRDLLYKVRDAHPTVKFELLPPFLKGTWEGSKPLKTSPKHLELRDGGWSIYLIDSPTN
jgi:hypothetical protein